MSHGDLTEETEGTVSRRTYLAAAGTGVAALAAGCSGDTGGSTGTTVGGGSATITFVIVPYDEPSRLRKTHEPILRYLEDRVSGLTVEPQVATDYGAVLPALRSNQAQLANDDVTLLAAPDTIEVVGINASFGAPQYFSMIVTMPDTGIEELTDFEGKTIAFADRLSTSGSIYPTYALQQAGLDVGDAPQGEPADYEGQWSTHNQARQTLFNRPEVVGAANFAGGIVPHIPSDQIPSKVENGSADLSQAGTKDPQVDLVHTSEPIPSSPVINSPEWTTKKESVTDALLNMTEEKLQPFVDEVSDVSMDSVAFFRIVEGSVDDYQPVITRLEALGVEPADLR